MSCKMRNINNYLWNMFSQVSSKIKCAHVLGSMYANVVLKHRTAQSIHLNKNLKEKIKTKVYKQRIFVFLP